MMQYMNDLENVKEEEEENYYSRNLRTDSV
jgi:hypothetical protein